MHFRKFAPEDAQFCFQLRNQAFTDLFGGQLQPEEVAAAVNAYQLADYIRMAGKGAFFIVEHRDSRAGFFYLQRIDPATAELCLIYIDPRFHQRGIGRGCIGHIDRWVSANWKKVDTLIVDTVIPGYNALFYQKAGFTPLGQSVCVLSGMPVKALRLSRRIKSSLETRPEPA